MPHSAWAGVFSGDLKNVMLRGSVLSDEKSAVAQTALPQKVKHCFSLTVSLFHFLSLIFRSLTLVCLGVAFFGFDLFGSYSAP